MVEAPERELMDRAIEGTARAGRRLSQPDIDKNALDASLNDAVRAMWQAVNAFLRELGVPEGTADVIVQLNERAVKRGLIQNELVQRLLDAESLKTRVNYDLVPTPPPERVGEFVSGAIRFIQEIKHSMEAAGRKRLRDAALKEHDMVVLTADATVDGFSLRKGMSGAVVAVYKNGDAYEVEFPEVTNGPAVVTLRAAQIEPAKDGANE